MRPLALLLALGSLALASSCDRRVRVEFHVDEDEESSDADPTADDTPAGSASDTVPDAPSEPSQLAPLDVGAARAALERWLTDNVGHEPAHVVLAAEERSERRVLFKVQPKGSSPGSLSVRVAESDRGRWEVAGILDGAAGLYIRPEAWLLDWHAAHAMQTMTSMRMLATAVEAYSIDNGYYPEANDVTTLASLVEPIYIRTLPREDAWGREFDFWTGKGGMTYCLLSAGGDGRLERPLAQYRKKETWHGSSAARSDASRADLLFCTGGFVTWYERGR